MLNCGPLPLSYDPSARNCSRCGPSVPQHPARCFSTRLNANASCPAGTGVCVVKTVVWRISSSAASNDVAVFDQIADALEHDEAGVAFVQVKHAGADAECLQRAHAADAEDDFLLDARFAIAAVQPRRQLAIPRRVLFEIRVEQIQPHAAETDTPDRHEHGAFAERHRGDARLAIGQQRPLDGRIGPIEALVAFFLPAFG